MAAISAAPAYAQDATSNVGLQEIVVTAQKRAENVQDTPLSVTAVSGQALQTQGITQVAELNRIDPALQIGQATGTVTTFIRGIGNPVTTSGNEASVPVYIDDVYFVRASAPFFDLASIDRVEVLKGPQGTLFGRNASGGVISIYTRDPTFVPALEARIGYANYQTMDAKLYANLPVTDTLAANVSVSYHNQDQGWGRNKKLVDPLDTSLGYQPGGEDYWKGHSFSARGKILWEPTDTTAVKLIGYYQKSWSQIGIYSRPFPGTVGGSPDPAHNGFANLPGVFPTPSQELPELGFYDVALGDTQQQYDKSEGYGFSGRIDQELGFADLVSITAYRNNDELYASAGNYSPYDWTRYDLNIVDKQFSQEFQIKAKPSSPVNWIFGLFYLNADGGFDPTTIYGPGMTGSGIDHLNIYGHQKVKSYASFGQITYPITDTTNITAGLRYTIDKVRGEGRTDITFLPGVLGADSVTFTDQIFDANNNCSNILAATFFGGTLNGTCDAPNDDVSKTTKKLTWKANIDQKIGPDAMIYANYARGYKAGTFNTLPLDSAALNPEVVDAYEIGFKSEFAGRTIRLNGALFWNDISDAQVQAQRNGLVFLQNAGTARTKGAEFDLTVAAAQGLTLRLAGTYLDAKFRKFDGCATYQYSTVAPGNLDQLTTNCAGNYMPYASKWKFSSSIDYTHDFAFGEASFNLTANYASRFNWDADNVIKEPEHLLLDGSISLTPASQEHFTLRLWMKNITDEKFNINYYAQASGSAYSSAPGAPRTFGGELVFKF
ncbi:MAG: TonB-dependent receptor [Novosphingobium sp.]